MWNFFKKKNQKKPFVLTVKIGSFLKMIAKLHYDMHYNYFKPDQNIIIHSEIDNQDLVFKIISDEPTPENSPKSVGYTTARAGETSSAENDSNS